MRKNRFFLDKTRETQSLHSYLEIYNETPLGSPNSQKGASPMERLRTFEVLPCHGRKYLDVF
jgi:hypothetical protein